MTDLANLVYIGNMHIYSVHEAKTHLSRLIRQVQAGEEVMITSNGKRVAKVSAPESPKKKRIIGDLAHLAHLYPIPDDFDEPMPDEWFFPDENKFNK